MLSAQGFNQRPFNKLRLRVLYGSVRIQASKYIRGCRALRFKVQGFGFRASGSRENRSQGHSSTRVPHCTHRYGMTSPTSQPCFDYQGFYIVVSFGAEVLEVRFGFR